MSDKINSFIASHWDECIKMNQTDEGTLIGLPYPYTVPAVGHFDEMYYWDTYFTNLGLFLDGRALQAKTNTDNMLYLVNQYGFMPNGNRTSYLSQSQPPFLSEMVRDVYAYYQDQVWLIGAYETLKKEYQFWMEKRSTPIGLNRYGCDLTGKNMDELAEYFAGRVGFMPDMDAESIAYHCITTCESGWDINPRWDTEAMEYCPAELNSLLYGMEQNMAYFANVLDNADEEEWSARAERRRNLMQEYLVNEDGLFMDYQYKTNQRNSIFSVASLYPLFVGVATKEQAKAAVENLWRLEGKFGLFTCEKNEVHGMYQWDYPNGWACLQYIAMKAFDRYGLKETALRIAEKYLAVVEKVFDETGNLWEKYNVEDGSLNVNNEYDMPAMMGWSAGVYLAAEAYRRENQK